MSPLQLILKLCDPAIVPIYAGQAGYIPSTDIPVLLKTVDMRLKALYPEFESVDLPLQVVVLPQHAGGVHLRVMSRPSLLSDDPFQLG